MNIIVYCGANKGNQEIFQESAVRLGKWIVENNHTLIFGGGKAGLMGILADTVLQSGGKAIGVIPTFLKERELAYPNLTKMYEVPDMIARKAQMFQLAEVFIALPGGPGTLEEITEMISWGRIGQNPHPCILFNVDGYYDFLAKTYDNMVDKNFLFAEDRKKILFSDSLSEIEEFIASYTPPFVRQY